MSEPRTAQVRMAIGRDIDLLCEAATWAARKRFGIGQRSLQRALRVGFVKADRLLLLLDDYGVTDGFPLTRWSSRSALITEADLPGKLAELRQAVARELSDGNH